MRRCALILLFLILQSSASLKEPQLTISHQELKDKIRGGWAGQTIGVTFGGPTEFRFNGTMIQDYHKITWYNGYLKETFENKPGLYDDLYVDLTFVQVFENEGLNAPAQSFATAYANAGYMLWHANQAGRYNILHGINPPQSGHWLNNPHADDIDFQIEADFAGLMTPGMPQEAGRIADKIGHIMNYGDGFYGGLFIANLYSLAFTNNHLERIIAEALKSIPARSEFHQCISDVVTWHKQYPDDWKRTWFELQKKWAEDIGCPDGVFSVFDTDPKLNAAYVVLGLLYGETDFTRTMEITTRAGQDSDCNPSSAGGILGVILGYDKIPDYWKQGLDEIEDLDFKYTTMSLNDAYDASYRHALQLIEQNKGKVRDKEVTIALQKPVTAAFEKSFENHYPVEKRWMENKIIEDEIEFEFEGIGFVVRGESARWNSTGEYVFEAELYVDNKFIERAQLPVSFTTRRTELFWKYQLTHGKHQVRIRLLNPNKEHRLMVTDVVVYDVRTK